MMRARQGGDPSSLPHSPSAASDRVKSDPPAADYETRRLQIALAMIKQEIELIRLLTETHRLRQQIDH
jgi:hypothetical protein